MPGRGFRFRPPAELLCPADVGGRLRKSQLRSLSLHANNSADDERTQHCDLVVGTLKAASTSHA
jgi:hypothetical protein